MMPYSSADASIHSADDESTSGNGQTTLPATSLLGGIGAGAGSNSAPTYSSDHVERTDTLQSASEEAIDPTHLNDDPLTITTTSEEESTWQELIDIGEQLLTQYASTNDATSLQEAVESFRIAAQLGLGRRRDATSTFTRLATLLIPRTETENDHDNRDDSETPGPLPAEEQSAWDELTEEGKRLLGQYDANNDVSALQEAVEHFRAAALLGSDATVTGTITQLTCALPRLLDQNGSKDDVVKSSEPNVLQENSFIASKENPFSVWKGLVDLGEARWRLFSETGDLKSLQVAIDCFRHAAPISIQSGGSAPYTLFTLGTFLMGRFERLQDSSDLDEAIADYNGALILTPTSHPSRGQILDYIVIAYFKRFERLGNRTDLDNAIVEQEAALTLGPLDSANRYTKLTFLAHFFKTRFEITENLADLDRAISDTERALGLTVSSDPDHSSTFNNLVEALKIRFKKIGDLADLDRAIALCERDLEQRPPGHPLRWSSFENLAAVFSFRFENGGTIGDLENSILNYQSALELAPLGHPDRLSILSHLANALCSRFKETGGQIDLENAIIYHETALDEAPFGQESYSRIVIDLTTALQLRFEHVGDRADLDKAISMLETASIITPVGSDLRDLTLNNLAGVLKTRWEQTNNQVDLDQGIVILENILERRLPGHPLRPLSLNNLANALGNRFRVAGNPDDLTRAVTYHEDVLAFTPPGHPLYSLSLTNLAIALLSQYELLGDPNDLSRVIASHETVLELRPPGHPRRSWTLGILAEALLIRLDQPESQDNLQVASSISTSDNEHAKILALLEEATLPETGGPLSARLDAALSWINVALKWEDTTAVRAYLAALHVLEAMIIGETSLQSQHSRLTSVQVRRTRSLAVDGAACAIAAGQVKLAVEILEQGRNMLLTQAGKYRTPIDKLKKEHPALADEFRKASHAVESSTPERPNTRHTSHHQALKAWQDVVLRIRSRETFESFLLPTAFAILRKVAASGPVVIINISEKRSDAIIVQQNSDPLLVQLPNATPHTVALLASKAGHGTNDHDFKAMLTGTWASIMQPIIEILRVDNPRGSRIWWCPTASAALLPLHAAGDYSMPGKNLPDMYVSSYTPTLSALLSARRAIPTQSASARRMLLVGQSDPQSRNPLASVPVEMTRIRSVASHATIMEDADAIAPAVLDAMQDHSRIHLSCHGHVNHKQPFLSHFSLYDGPLTVSEIVKKNLPDAELAFLSACHSAAGSRDIPDEVMHLAASLQFAGFRSVVGTMWAMADVDGPEVAETFYSSLLGHNAPVAPSSAHALHRAVGKLRRNRVPMSRWACFVHFGC